jgi:hypothetical protein
MQAVVARSDLINNIPEQAVASKSPLRYRLPYAQ